MRLFATIPLLIVFSFPAFAEEMSDSEIALEEQAVEMATQRSYPGGMDEDNLSVQPELTFAEPHITAATLQWRTLNAINRSSAAEKNSETSSEE